MGVGGVAGAAGGADAVKQDEHQEQVTLFAWARLEESRFPELSLLFAVPNGGARNVVTGQRLKQEGVKRGVPDVWLPVARCGYHGLVIELKAGKGRPTAEQKAWLKALAAQGWLTQVCVGFEAARDVLVRYLDGSCRASAAMDGADSER